MEAGDASRKNNMELVAFVPPNAVLLQNLLKDCLMRYVKWQWVMWNLMRLDNCCPQIDKYTLRKSMSAPDVEYEITISRYVPMLSPSSSSKSKSPSIKSKSSSTKSKSCGSLHKSFEDEPLYGKPKKFFIGRIKTEVLIKAKYAEVPKKRKNLMTNDQAAKIVNEKESPIAKFYWKIRRDNKLSTNEKKKQITKLKKCSPYSEKEVLKSRKLKKSGKTIEHWKETLNDLLDSNMKEKRKNKLIQKFNDKHPGVHRCVMIAREIKEEFMKKQAHYCQKITVHEYETNKLDNTAKALREQLLFVLDTKTMSTPKKMEYVEKFAENYPHMYHEIRGQLPPFPEKRTAIVCKKNKQKSGRGLGFIGKLKLFKKSRAITNKIHADEDGLLDSSDTTAVDKAHF